MDAIQKRPTTQLSRRGFISTLSKVALAATSVALGVTAEVAAAAETALESPRWAVGGDADDRAQLPLIMAMAGVLAGNWAKGWLREAKTTAEDGKAAVDKILKDGTY